MSRFVYKEDIVNTSLNKLDQARETLSQTEAALNEGFNQLSQVNGAQFIDYGSNREIICKFPEDGRTYINELKKAIEGKCAEIKDYNSAPFWKKIFAGAGMRIAKFGEGFFTAFENMLDAGVGIVGYVGGIFNKDFQSSCAEFIKNDLSGSLVSNVYKEGTFIGKYSDISANSVRANIYKGFGTATGYIVIGKVAGKLNKGIDKLFKANLRVSETGINSLVAGVGGIGSGTETSLLMGKSFDESFFQGIKTGAIQGGAAYIIGQAGDKFAKDRMDSLKQQHIDLQKEKAQLSKIKNPTADQVARLNSIDDEILSVNNKIVKLGGRIEDLSNGYDKGTGDVGAGKTSGAKSTEKIGNNNGIGKDGINKTPGKAIDAKSLTENDIDDIISRAKGSELTKTGDELTEVVGKNVESNISYDRVSKYNAKQLNNAKSVEQVSAYSTGASKPGYDFVTKGIETVSTKGVSASPHLNKVLNTMGNVAVKTVTTPALAQGGIIGATSTYNSIKNTEARINYNIAHPTVQPKQVSIIPTNNGANSPYSSSNSSNNKSTVSSRSSYSNNSNSTPYTGHVLQQATIVSNPSEVAKTSPVRSNNTATTPTTPKAELTHNTSSGGGRSFASPSSSPSSTPTTSTSSLATSIGTIKANNNKPITTNTTTTTTTTSKTQDITPAATSTQSAISPYQYPTSTQVVAGGNKYPVNKPQIEGSLAQNNVSTTTLGSSGSTHGGGGYSKGGFSLSGSSAVTSDGTIGEQDTKGTLASSITKNKSSKTETIRISESEEEIDQEQKANNFVIPTSAALSAAAAAGIGAKIVMDKKDKDKEEEKEQEESDDDFEIISSDFDNFENDIDDNNNEYEVVESY